VDLQPTLTAAGHGSSAALTLTAMGRLPKVLPATGTKGDASHVFESPDLWQPRIDAAFRDQAPRIERIDGGDYVVVEADQILSGIGLISNAGAPEPASANTTGTKSGPCMPASAIAWATRPIRTPGASRRVGCDAARSATRSRSPAHWAPGSPRQSLPSPPRSNGAVAVSPSGLPHDGNCAHQFANYLAHHPLASIRPGRFTRSSLPGATWGSGFAYQQSSR
jgi:hypothetical protein